MLSPSNGGVPFSSKDGDYWTKIIMHNVEQFQKDKDAVMLKVKEDQMRIREELLRQMEQHKQAKVDAKRGTSSTSTTSSLRRRSRSVTRGRRRSMLSG
jgi:hypothetical protein